MEFAGKLVKEGVQPLIGCQLDLGFTGESPDAGRGGQRRTGTETSPVVLIASTGVGYANLVRLVSRAYLANPPGEPPRVSTAWLEELGEGLICLTGGPEGPVVARWCTTMRISPRTGSLISSVSSATGSMSNRARRRLTSRRPEAALHRLSRTCTSCRWSQPTRPSSRPARTTTPTTPCIAIAEGLVFVYLLHHLACFRP